jgi:hypothetical protein
MSQDEDTEGITSEQLIAKYQNLKDQSRIKALEGLDKIDWSMLHHAYGEASDFPPLFRATFSRNKRDREFALKLLFETIWHQGTVYHASAYAVPFLLKALESPETPDKTAIAILLACLADGHSYLEVHALSNKKNEDSWKRILAKDNRELGIEITKEIEYVNAARKAVGKGLHLLYPYLQDENASLEIAKALAFYPEHKTEIIPLLEEAQASISDKFAKEEIQLTIAKLRETNES